MSKIVITLEAEPEFESPEHSEKVTFSAPGYAKAVRSQMKKAIGGWGWCSAKVGVTITSNKTEPAVGTSYLGNCSYLSAEDFAENSGYFQQMVDEALKEALKDRKKAIKQRINISHKAMTVLDEKEK